MKAADQENDFKFLRWLRWRHAGIVVVVTLLLEWSVGVYWHLQKQDVRPGIPPSLADWNADQWSSVLIGGLSVVQPVFTFALVLVAVGCGVIRMANEKWAPPRGPTIWFVALSVLFTLIVSHAAYFLQSTGKW
jgi:hypothetical protein